MAVTASGGVAGASERLDRLFGPVAWNEPHSELPQHSVSIEDGGAVHLAERVTERRQVGGGTDAQWWRCREPLLDRRAGITVGSVMSSAPIRCEPRSWIANSASRRCRAGPGSDIDRDATGRPAS